MEKLQASKIADPATFELIVGILTGEDTKGMVETLTYFDKQEAIYLSDLTTLKNRPAVLEERLDKLVNARVLFLERLAPPPRPPTNGHVNGLIPNDKIILAPARTPAQPYEDGKRIVDVAPMVNRKGTLTASMCGCSIRYNEWGFSAKYNGALVWQVCLKHANEIGIETRV